MSCCNGRYVLLQRQASLVVVESTIVHTIGYDIDSNWCNNLYLIMLVSMLTCSNVSTWMMVRIEQWYQVCMLVVSWQQCTLLITISAIIFKMMAHSVMQSISMTRSYRVETDMVLGSSYPEGRVSHIPYLAGTRILDQARSFCFPHEGPYALGGFQGLVIGQEGSNARGLIGLVDQVTRLTQMSRSTVGDPGGLVSHPLYWASKAWRASKVQGQDRVLQFEGGLPQLGQRQVSYMA